jgi:hypothetical protein
MKTFLSIIGKSFLFLSLMSFFYVIVLLMIWASAAAISLLHANVLIYPLTGAGLLSGWVVSFVLACKVMRRFERPSCEL